VAPGVVLNKDGSFQRTARFRGPDLDSAVPAELVGVAGRLNNVAASAWIGLGALRRGPAAACQHLSRGQVSGRGVGAGRRRAQGRVRGGGRALRVGLFPDLSLSAAGLGIAGAERFLYEGRDRAAGADAREILAGFVDRTDRVLQLLEGFMPECHWLDDAETLTYLHSCISTRRQRVRVPEVPMYLDGLLADQPLIGGLEPKLGDCHLRVLTIVGFPATTTRDFSTSSIGWPSPIAGRRARSCSTRPTPPGC
jgi:type IV secretory pathway VirB4 component